MTASTITTPDELEALRQQVGTLVVLGDDGPVIVWMGEDQNWHSVRALTEDDWAAGRTALGQPGGIDLDADTDDLLPQTVLWHDGMRV